MSKTLATCTILSLCLILLGVNRGFDISDEGLYMLLANPDQENIAGIFNYDLFFKLFSKTTGIEFGIVGMRLLRLLSYFLAGISLAYFWRNLTGTNKLSLNLFLVSLLGLFAGYGFLPQSLSYNSLSVVLTCFWLALISRKDKAVAQYLLLGLLLGCMVYVKATAVLGLGILTIASMFWMREVKGMYLLALLLPFPLIELLLYLSLDDFAVSRIMDVAKMMGNRSEYSFFLLIKYSAVGFFWLALTSAPFLVASSIDDSQPKMRFSIVIVGILSLGCIAYFTTITHEWTHIILLLTVAILAYLTPRVPFAAISPEQRFLLLILLVLPFVLHFGSNVYWLRLSIHYWVFWVLACYFLISLKQKKSLKYLSASVGILALLLVANGIWIHPFEQEPLWKANRKWDYSNGNQILLSEKQIAFFSMIKPVVQDEEQLLAFYRIPGIPYLLDKTSLKSPGFWTKNQIEYFFNSDFQTDLVLFYSLDSLPSFVKGNFSKKYVQLPHGEEIQILWRQ